MRLIGDILGALLFLGLAGFILWLLVSTLAGPTEVIPK